MAHHTGGCSSCLAGREQEADSTEKPAGKGPSDARAGAEGAAGQAGVEIEGDAGAADEQEPGSQEEGLPLNLSLPRTPATQAQVMKANMPSHVPAGTQCESFWLSRRHWGSAQGCQPLLQSAMRFDIAVALSACRSASRILPYNQTCSAMHHRGGILL